MNVLVVDDSRTIRVQARIALEAAGAKVLDADSADNGLLILRGNVKVDMVITDQMMPEKTGLQMLEEWNAGDKGINQDTIVVFMSSDSTIETRVTAKSLGAKAFILKPVEAAVLADLVKKFS